MELKALGIDNKLLKKLKNNNINTVKELWSLSRKSLKNLNFNYTEINEISIKLQLKGLDFNRKKYK